MTLDDLKRDVQDKRRAYMLACAALRGERRRLKDIEQAEKKAAQEERAAVRAAAKAERLRTDAKYAKWVEKAQKKRERDRARWERICQQREAEDALDRERAKIGPFLPILVSTYWDGSNEVAVYGQPWP